MKTKEGSKTTRLTTCLISLFRMTQHFLELAILCSLLVRNNDKILKFGYSLHVRIDTECGTKSALAFCCLIGRAICYLIIYFFAFHTLAYWFALIITFAAHVVSWLHFPHWSIVARGISGTGSNFRVEWDTAA